MGNAASSTSLLLLVAALACGRPAHATDEQNPTTAVRTADMALALHSAERVAVNGNARPCVINVLQNQRLTLDRTNRQVSRAAALAAAAGCPGPWSRVVADLSAHASGRTEGASGQLRIGSINVAGLRLPAAPTGYRASTWSTSIDVTDYVALLRKPQHVGISFHGNTDTDATVTVSLSLTFQPANASAKPASAPDTVLPAVAGRIAADSTADAMVRIPRNTVRLAAAVQVRGDGGCDGGWWVGAANASAGSCADPPLREIALYVDGRLAGLVLPYPDVADSAATRWWAPLTAPRALVTRSWKLDLTPFVGLLTEDRPHSFALGVRGQPAMDTGRFSVDLHLLAHTARSPARTIGGLLYARATGQPSVQTTSHAQVYRMRANDRFEAAGWLHTGDGVASTTTVSQTIGARAERGDGGRLLKNRYDHQQRISRTITAANGRSKVIRNSENNNVIINRLRDGWDIADIGDQTVTVDGKQAFHSRRKDSLSSVVDADGRIQSSREWSYADSSGRCANNRLVAESPRLLAQRSDRQCIW